MKKKFRRVLHHAKRLCFSICSAIIRLFCRVNSKKAIFSSFLGGSYSDNPRAISEKLHERNPDFAIVWAFKNPREKQEILPPYIKCVKFGSLRALYHQTTAGFWIDNYCKPLETKKRAGQYYIQTWHGDRGLKKVLMDMYEDNSQIRLFESENCDLAIAGSEFGRRIYHSSFDYHGEILCAGCPRNDLLVNGDPETVSRFKAAYGIPHDVKLLLYAPTFRDSNKQNLQRAEGLDMAEVIRKLEGKTGDIWYGLVRGHTGRKIELGDTESVKIIDVTAYEDAKDVLLCADAVISDYSTVSTDFALLGRPIFLYIDDLDDYEKNSRALWYKMDDTPFWYAKTQKELIELIDRFTFESAKENCLEILDFYQTCESGRSSEQVCEYIERNALI